MSAEVLLADVPFHPQEAHQCGPASLLTVLEASGVSADYEVVAARVYVPGLEGSLQSEILASARELGRIAYVIPPEPRAVLAEVTAGRPVLVLLNLGVPSSPIWHYAVVVGADPRHNRLVLHSGGKPFSRQRASRWLRRWNWAGRWAVVLLAPGQWPASADRHRLLEALAAFEDSADARSAETAWRAAVEHWPEEHLAWFGLANAAYRQGRLKDAQRGYARALEIAPDNLPARLNLVVALAEDGRACEALEILGSAPPEGHSLGATFSGIEARIRSSCPERS